MVRGGSESGGEFDSSSPHCQKSNSPQKNHVTQKITCFGYNVNFTEADANMATADEPLAKRYKKVTNSDILKKEEEYKNANSAANERKAVKNFKMYLQFNEKDTDFFNFEEPELDEWLGKFYLGTRTEKGEYYSSGSLHTLRYGLNRALQQFGHAFDITDKKSSSFRGSNKAFELAMEEIKNAGKGHRKATPEITPSRK